MFTEYQGLKLTLPSTAFLSSTYYFDLEQIIYAMPCNASLLYLHAFNHILLQELLHREIMIWMSKNYCRWSIIGEEGEVL